MIQKQGQRLVTCPSVLCLDWRYVRQSKGDLVTQSVSSPAGALVATQLIVVGRGDAAPPTVQGKGESKVLALLLDKKLLCKRKRSIDHSYVS